MIFGSNSDMSDVDDTFFSRKLMDNPFGHQWDRNGEIITNRRVGYNYWNSRRDPAGYTRHGRMSNADWYQNDPVVWERNAKQIVYENSPAIVQEEKERAKKNLKRKIHEVEYRSSVPNKYVRDSEGDKRDADHLLFGDVNVFENLVKDYEKGVEDQQWYADYVNQVEVNRVNRNQANERRNAFDEEKIVLDRYYKELKVHDVNCNNEQGTYDGYFFPSSKSLCLINNGLNSSDRTGSKIVVKQIEIKFLIKCEDFNSTEPYTNPVSRMLLVVDTQASLPASSVDDILSFAGTFAYINPNEKQRFHILLDESFVHNLQILTPITTTSETESVVVPGIPLSNVETTDLIANRRSFFFERTFKEDELIGYNDTNPPTASDLTASNYFMILFGYKNYVTMYEYISLFEGKVRVTYKDLS